MTARPDHVDVAAYVLGVLDEDEVDAFENHLAQCRRCALDLRDFAVLPDLLDEADANCLLRANAGERPDGRSVRAMLDTVARDRSRRRRNAVLRSAAAAVLLVVLTTAVVRTRWTPEDDEQPSAAAPSVSGPTAVANNSPDDFTAVTRTDLVTGVWARVVPTDESWGTALALEVKGVKGVARCELVVRSRAGATATIGSWLAPGDGEPVQLGASVGLRWAEIAEFAVRDAGSGATLVRLPAG
ncbi:anti-sigma factor family protein [Saccharothrix obliqua]|uniref:anti-sigma factor family protein n=1 Tax=Saccharothrix obliqua TaxID=2861747 RepID=UPI001C5DCF40|nr:zf-HC2 domain-containing protein [Saccharothrix obliqua]MBW4721273.1 zf-HC2 domain-containing protein [Saccharothrix obliqua]